MIEEYFDSHKINHLEVKKSTVLQAPGKVATEAYYVKSGLLRSYLMDDNGKKHILMFAPEGWIISDIESHTLSKPTELYIDAMEESELFVIKITSETFTSVNKNYLSLIHKLFRRIAVLQKRVILLMSSTAKQRYEHFIETYPQLVNRVPLKMIAAYLGITPEALSNIRGKMRKERFQSTPEHQHLPKL